MGKPKFKSSLFDGRVCSPTVRLTPPVETTGHWAGTGFQCTGRWTIGPEAASLQRAPGKMWVGPCYQGWVLFRAMAKPRVKIPGAQSLEGKSFPSLPLSESSLSLLIQRKCHLVQGTILRPLLCAVPSRVHSTL